MRDMDLKIVEELDTILPDPEPTPTPDVVPESDTRTIPEETSVKKSRRKTT